MFCWFQGVSSSLAGDGALVPSAVVSPQLHDRVYGSYQRVWGGCRQKKKRFDFELCLMAVSKIVRGKGRRIHSRRRILAFDYGSSWTRCSSLGKGFTCFSLFFDVVSSNICVRQRKKTLQSQVRFRSLIWHSCLSRSTCASSPNMALKRQRKTITSIAGKDSQINLGNSLRSKSPSSPKSPHLNLNLIERDQCSHVANNCQSFVNTQNKLPTEQRNRRILISLYCLLLLYLFSVFFC